MKWECFLCWKVNEEDGGVAEANCVCRCCGRPRSYFPKSLVAKDRPKPLLLHGLVTAQHELHPTLIRSLQLAGLDFSATDSAGWTALHCAAMLGDSTAVCCLVQTKDKQLLEARRNGGWSALHLATRGGHLEAVKELLLADAEVDGQLDASDDAMTSLHIAAGQGHVDILNLLLQCGADPMLLTHHLRRTALHVAVAAGHLTCVRLLAQSNLVNIPDSDGLTALQLACILPRSKGNPDSNKREMIALLESNLPIRATPPALQTLFN